MCGPPNVLAIMGVLLMPKMIMRFLSVVMSATITSITYCGICQHLHASSVTVRSIETHDQTNVSNPIKRVSGEVHLDVLTDRFQDQAQHRYEQHQQKSFNAPEDVHELGERELGATTHDIRNDANSRQKTMSMERGSDVRVECDLNRE